MGGSATTLRTCQTRRAAATLLLALVGLAGCTIGPGRPVVFAEFNPGTLRSFSEVEPTEYLRLFTALDYRITILLRRRDPIPCGQDAGRVMSALEATGLDQVDLMLTPPAAAGQDRAAPWP